MSTMLKKQDYILEHCENTHIQLKMTIQRYAKFHVYKISVFYVRLLWMDKKAFVAGKAKVCIISVGFKSFQSTMGMDDKHSYLISAF